MPNSLPKDLQDKTIFISGAAGFIPGHVAEFYLDLGAKIIGVDNFISGSRSTVTMLEKNPHYTFIEQDISQGLPDISEKIDFILHLASPASPIDFPKYPLEIMDVNAHGTRHLLNLAKEKQARFLLASTSEVYGDPTVHPQPEDYFGYVNPIGDRACYDESKRFAECLVSVYRKSYELDTRIVRIFNTYGPRMRLGDGRVIPNFIGKAIKNETLKIYGDGSQTRSFCYVTDLVQAIHQVLFLGDNNPYNIGNSDEYTIKDLATTIIKKLGSESVIEYAKLPSDDPKKRRPDLSRLKSLMNYQPAVDLSTGILHTAEYFKSVIT